LTAPDTAAHIHCCGPLGTNVSVAMRKASHSIEFVFPVG
jgi:hypothetical protein